MACRVLVTGSEGFIGSALIERLSGQGHQIVRYDLLTGQDVVDERVLREYMRGCSVVYNLAGEIRVPRSFDVPVVYWRNNTLGALTVARIASELGVKMVQASSSSVIAGTASHYAMSKQAAEKIILHEIRRNGLKASIARIFNVYGPCQPDDFVVPKFINLALRNKDIVLHNGGGISKDFIHVDDVAEGLIRCADSSGPLYDLGTGKTTQIGDLAKMVIKSTGSKSRLTVDFDRDRVMEKSLSADLKKVPKKWSGKISIEEGVLRMVGGIRETVKV